ncbi:MAG: TrmH family RNA methyltransferase [Clostridia bacterium]|nr:TrmH family RNA methyltransferase [Clostridia bacterium]
MYVLMMGVHKAMAKLEAYSKSLDYSYAPGIFPATECLNHAKDRCMRLLLSSASAQSEGAAKLREAAEQAGVRAEIADRALERISKKENCFAAMVYRKEEGVFDDASPHVVLHHPSDSGNLGTILRTALGFGLRNIAIIRPAVDSDDPRVTRASMGAAFSMHVRHFDSFEAYRAEYPDRQLFPFMLTGAVPLDEAVRRVNGPFSLVFGNEASGLPDEFAQWGVSTLIPHSASIDSLNLAIAAGIGMYAFTRK